MVAHMRNIFVELGRDERGLTVVEIVLLIALIILPLVLVLILFGKDVKALIGSMWKDTVKSSVEMSKGISSGSAP
jgi:Flp pilus assembly pilin Flp